MKYLVRVNGKQMEVEVEVMGAGSVPAAAAAPAVAAPTAPAAEPAAPAGVANLKVESPMPGNVFKIQVSVGQSVAEGETLIILEAMKMENDIVAPRAGTVKQILVSQGTAVNTGDVMIVLS